MVHKRGDEDAIQVQAPGLWYRSEACAVAINGVYVADLGRVNSTPF